MPDVSVARADHVGVAGDGRRDNKIIVWVARHGWHGIGHGHEFRQFAKIVDEGVELGVRQLRLAPNAFVPQDASKFHDDVLREDKHLPLGKEFDEYGSRRPCGPDRGTRQNIRIACDSH
jgi:hypothetical protein